MLDLAVLGLLMERPMHGYELRKQLAGRLGLFWTVSFGSLYPTLRKLERSQVIAKAAPQDTASRRKLVYSITPAGEQLFLELLGEGGSSSVWEEEKFSLRLAFFSYLKPETRIRLLERRRRYLEEQVEDATARVARATGPRADRYTLSLLRHGLEITEREVAWLDELIATERRLAESETPHREAGSVHSEPPAAASPPPAEPPATAHGGVQSR